MTQIMFPVVLLLGMSSVLTGILQSYDEFSLPALAPVVWNIVIIALTVVLRTTASAGRESTGTRSPGWSRPCAVGFDRWALRRIDYRPRFEFDWRDPRIRQVFTLMLPVTLGLGIINLDALINSTMGALVASAHGTARVRSSFAFLIYMLPQGVFSVAVSTVLFPTLSRQAARRAPPEMRHSLGNGMRQIILLLVPSAAE